MEQTYITPNNTVVTINNEFIKCHKIDDEENSWEYKLQFCNKRNTIPLKRSEPLLVCFLNDKGTVDMVKFDSVYGKGNFTTSVQDNKLLLELHNYPALLDFMMEYFVNGNILCYLQYIDVVNYTGFKFVYMSVNDGSKYDMDEVGALGDNTDVFEVFNNTLIEDYNVILFDDKTLKRKELTYYDYYMLTKVTDEDGLLENLDNFITNKEKLNIFNMNRAIVYINKNILDIINTKNINKQTELLKAGYKTISKYHEMDISYILKQLQRLYKDKSLDVIEEMVSTTPYRFNI